MVSVHQKWLEPRVVCADNAASGMEMVHFICQLVEPQAPRYLVKHYPDVSMRVVLGEISICIHWPSKADALPSEGRPCSISWKPEQNKKADHPVRVFAQLSLLSDLFFFLFCLQTGSETLGLPGSTNLQTSFSPYGSCSHCLLFPFWLSISHDPNFSSGVELCAGPENPSTVAGSEPLTYSLCSVKLLLMPGLLIL